MIAMTRNLERARKYAQFQLDEKFLTKYPIHIWPHHTVGATVLCCSEKPSRARLKERCTYYILP